MVHSHLKYQSQISKEKRKKIYFVRNIFKLGVNITLLNGTHECYNDFVLTEVSFSWKKFFLFLMKYHEIREALIRSFLIY